MFVSGMDYLYSDIKTYSRHEKFKIKIVLPQEKITEDLVNRTREKMKRYCRFKIEENQKELIALTYHIRVMFPGKAASISSQVPDVAESQP